MHRLFIYQTLVKAMWKLELDEEYFRIYDSKKRVAGYFDPDYGDIGDGEDSTDVISQMLKNRAAVPGGYIMVPLVKFNLFDSDLNIEIDELESQVGRAAAHIAKWKDFLAKTDNRLHYIRISHTDQDMLTITFPVRFSGPVRLEKSEIIDELVPILDWLQKLGLL